MNKSAAEAMIANTLGEVKEYEDIKAPYNDPADLLQMNEIKKEENNVHSDYKVI